MVSSIVHPKLKILVTGAEGFIGRNLIAILELQDSFCIQKYDRSNSLDELDEDLATTDMVFHLAGVNRPRDEREFEAGNAEFSTLICNRLRRFGRSVPIVFSSSIQVNRDNPYGVSKLKAEESMKLYASQQNARVVIFRLKNVFGKWCRPNYNSVVATYCYNVAHDLPVKITDPDRKLELVYIDDVVHQFLAEIHSSEHAGVYYRDVSPSYQIRLTVLESILQSFRGMRKNLFLPDLGDEFTRKLYGTYLTYLEMDDFAYSLGKKSDSRGNLAEFVKLSAFGQLFVSRTHPGITRGNHFHNTKAEKFLVVEGDAMIRLRHVSDNQIIEFHIKGDDFRVIDIPPGYSHSIENIGPGELVTLFWSSDIFDPEKPDTNGFPVLA